MNWCQPGGAGKECSKQGNVILCIRSVSRDEGVVREDALQASRRQVMRGLKQAIVQSLDLIQEAIENFS